MSDAARVTDWNIRRLRDLMGRQYLITGDS